MDLKFQTSFIPKRPIVPAGMATKTREPMNFFSLLAGLIFLIAALSSGGVFLYQKTLAASNEQKKEQIKSEIAAFEPELTEKLSILKARIDGASELLRTHTALSAFFALLQNNTVSTIQFEDFIFNGDKADDLKISMKGRARSFNDIVFQSDTILANSNIENALFSNFNLDQSGNVEFLLTARIDPSLVSYPEVIKRLSTSVPTQPSGPVIVDPSTQSQSATTSTTTTPTP
jgi:hypothetical protein